MSAAHKKHANTHDKTGRPWAKLSELKAGDKVELDNGFTCHARGVTRLGEDSGGLFFRCNGDKEKKTPPYRLTHHIAGQADDGEHLVGIYKVEV